MTPQDPVIAGAAGTWTIVYTAGLYGMDIGATLKVAFRLASDWGAPQFTHPGAPNYATVACSNPTVEVRARFDRKGHVRPWSNAIIVDVLEESMAEGDTITIVLGDRTRGGPGAYAQTFAEADFGFSVLSDPFATGIFVELPDSPILPVEAGPAARIRLVAPGQAEMGAAVTVLLKAEDEWGNVATSYVGEIRIEGGKEPRTVPVEPGDGGRVAVELVLPREKLVRLRALDPATGFEAISNPIFCPDGAAETGGMHLYWGDIHGQTGETVGTGTVASYFPFARDVALLDYTAHAANDFQITAEHYKDIQEHVRLNHVPGKFVTFLAFEWSGNTPGGGDHNVYFLNDDEPIHRSSHWQLDDWSDWGTDRYPITSIYEEYRGRSDVMVIPHIGGRRASLEYHDPDLSPFIEINSVHGRFEWFAREAMERGMRVGFVANSDDHTGRPGAAYPIEHFSVRGGLMATWARGLTRESLWEAFHARRVYGTSGERIVLRFWSDGHPMGEEYVASGPPQLRVAAAGTCGIERVEIWRDSQLFYVYRPADTTRQSRFLKVSWAGSRSRGRNRRMRWDGSLSVSGGVIVNARTVAFDTPREGIVAQDAQSVRWVSTTAGDPDGLRLELEIGDEAMLHIATPAIETDLRIADLAEGEQVLATSGLDGELRIAFEPAESQPSEVDFTVPGDSAPTPAAYWIRLVQVDGETAWSSPIFVDRMG